MGKWQEEGFVANSLDYYKDQLQQVFIAAFGNDFLLDDTLPQGILITRLAELFYNMDMDGIEAMSCLNLNTASGYWLDIIGGLRGLPRSQGTPQIVTVKITSNPNMLPYTIPQGAEFNSMDGADKFTAISGALVETQDVEVQLVYTESGDSSLSIGSKLQAPKVSGATDIEVTYLAEGLPRETDSEYRSRMRSEYPVANNTIEFVQNKLLELQFVKTVGCNYNDTADTVDTLPPYTTEWMAVPKKYITDEETGEDIEVDPELFKNSVATVIVNNKVPGSPTTGNTTVTVPDIFGTPKEVKFTIPDEIALEIEVQVASEEATGYIDLSNVPEIQEAIALYINGLKIGDDVSYTRCLKPLVNDGLFDIVSFKMRQKGTDEDWKVNTNYPITTRQYASITEADIKIMV